MIKKELEEKKEKAAKKEFLESKLKERNHFSRSPK